MSWSGTPSLSERFSQRGNLFFCCLFTQVRPRDFSFFTQPRHPMTDAHANTNVSNSVLLSDCLLHGITHPISHGSTKIFLTPFWRCFWPGSFKLATTGGSCICGTPNLAPGGASVPEENAPTNHPFTPSLSPPLPKFLAPRPGFNRVPSNPRPPGAASSAAPPTLLWEERTRKDSAQTTHPNPFVTPPPASFFDLFLAPPPFLQNPSPPNRAQSSPVLSPSPPPPPPSHPQLPLHLNPR